MISSLDCCLETVRSRTILCISLHFFTAKLKFWGKTALNRKHTVQMLTLSHDIGTSLDVFEEAKVPRATVHGKTTDR